LRRDANFNETLFTLNSLKLTTLSRKLATLSRAVGAVLFLSTATAGAQVYQVAPPPLGSDENDCLGASRPCATFQRAVNLCPPGHYCSIGVASGEYSQKISVIYYKVISFVGHQDSNGKCIDRNAVIIDDRVNGTGEAGAIFAAEDHSILTIQCMTLRAYARGSTGFITRQFAIGDVNNVDFGLFYEGLGIAASENSKINVHSPGILGNASYFGWAGDSSQLSIAGTVKIADGLTFNALFSVGFNSILSVNLSTIIGGDTISAMSYQCFDSIVKRNIRLPGKAPQSTNCKVYGPSDDLADVADHNKLESDVVELKLNGIETELHSMQAEIGMLRIYGIVALVAAILTIIFAGAIVIVRYQRWRHNDETKPHAIRH
jgi:hypothetical protein